MNTEETHTTPGEDDELTTLRARADMLGIDYSPRIGADKLRARIEKALADEPDEEEEEEVAAPVARTRPLTKQERENQIREQLFKEEMRLIRIRVTCMNPDKRDWPGEFITVGNRYLGNVSKLIPFGEANEYGYHIPHILLRELRNRKFVQKKVHVNKATGQIKVTTSEVAEFAIEVLPQLKRQELRRLATEQAAKAGMAEA